ncbi:hypothetical protein D3C81_173970 [compost metagenome]
MGMDPQRVGFENKAASSGKIPYTPLLKITASMGSSEKKSAERWNEMVKWIDNRGGMEDKD